jgi:archaellum component FlaC
MQTDEATDRIKNLENALEKKESELEIVKEELNDATNEIAYLEQEIEDLQ